jgi:hypothetical protein
VLFVVELGLIFGKESLRGYPWQEVLVVIWESAEREVNKKTCAEPRHDIWLEMKSAILRAISDLSRSAIQEAKEDLYRFSMSNDDNGIEKTGREVLEPRLIH